MAQELTLPDGRKLEYLVSGSADGFPLVFIHGTPGSYFVGSDLEAACTKKGIKLITLNRAGYGGSSRKRGRSVVDFVPDIEALLQHLGLKECVVGGRSGGGEFKQFVSRAQLVASPKLMNSSRASLIGRRCPTARLSCSTLCLWRGTLRSGGPRLFRRPG